MIFDLIKKNNVEWVKVNMKYMFGENTFGQSVNIEMDITQKSSFCFTSEP